MMQCGTCGQQFVGVHECRGPLSWGPRIRRQHAAVFCAVIFAACGTDSGQYAQLAAGPTPAPVATCTSYRVWAGATTEWIQDVTQCVSVHANDGTVPTPVAPPVDPAQVTPRPADCSACGFAAGGMP